MQAPQDDMNDINDQIASLMKRRQELMAARGATGPRRLTAAEADALSLDQFNDLRAQVGADPMTEDDRKWSREERQRLAAANLAVEDRDAIEAGAAAIIPGCWRVDFVEPDDDPLGVNGYDGGCAHVLPRWMPPGSKPMFTVSRQVQEDGTAPLVVHGIMDRTFAGAAEAMLHLRLSTIFDGSVRDQITQALSQRP